MILFPVAFLVGALVSDLVSVGTADAFWPKASMWMIGVAILMALVAALAGFIDFFGEPRIRRLTDAWYHMIGNLTAVVVGLVNFVLRYSQGAEAAIKPLGIVLARVVVGVLLFTGWKGWEMVYRYHVSVLDIAEQIAAQRGDGGHRRVA
ncbi:DUF2231 domain-containing protein [Bradyrhizobium sp. 143]|uniref:DUF2231 domain-containing protein n=1 Tax=unclassified Bradyrhizobium TaxID=2631580 RepID=UPI003207BA17